MTFVIFAGLVIVALAFLLSPVVFKSESDSRKLILRPYRNQLHELEKELERGTIEQTEAAGIRVEIERRILREDRERHDGGELTQAQKIAIGPAVGLVLMIGAAVVVFLSAVPASAKVEGDTIVFGAAVSFYDERQIFRKFIYVPLEQTPK